MSKNMEITVLEESVRVQKIQKEDYISLTDIAKHKNPDDQRFIIQNWIHTRFAIEFLGIWEHLNNPDFNRVEFEGITNEAGLNCLVLSVKQWTEKQIP